MRSLQVRVCRGLGGVLGWRVSALCMLRCIPRVLASTAAGSGPPA